MFKAQRGFTKEDIIILDPCWTWETIESLRQHGRDDDLICPVCKQPVLVRAGHKKRWHFAHKDLTNCPLKNESPNVLQARMLLYSWLRSKLGEKVTIEKHFQESDLPRPLDCYVDYSNELKIGYWILEKGIKERWALQHELSCLGINTVWVPLTDMLREDDQDQETVHLTPTERDITFSSDYDQLYSGNNNRSLSYLDIEKKTILTLRGLKCIHSPQKFYFCSKLETKLDQTLFLPQTGEFVHPDEHKQLEEYRREIKEQERIRAIEEQRRNEEQKKREQERAEQLKRIASQAKTTQVWDIKQPLPRITPVSPLHNLPPKEKKVANPYNNYTGKVYTCSICGKTTMSWTTLDMSNNTCVCSQECLAASMKKIK